MPSTSTEPTVTDAPRPSRRTARLVGVGAVVAGLIGSAALVWQASYSAFSSTTSNPTNNWSAGTVSLSDDDSGSALFTATNVKPGSTGSKCIVVTSSGSLAGTVKLYATASSFAQTNGLADVTTLTVTEGTNSSPASAGSCANFVADSGAGTSTTSSLTAFASAHTDFASGFGTWAPSGSGTESKVYKIDYSVSPSAGNSVQGGTAAIGFTWEAQNS